MEPVSHIRRPDHRNRNPNFPPVLGSWTNHVGRAANIATPSGPSQARAFSGALKAAGISADQISYIEAHGTGTALGDPVELRALASVFSAKSRNDETAAGAPVIIGSSKANLGHLESVSGIAGLIKTLLVLRHREVPPQIHLSALNPEIERATRNLDYRLVTPDTPAHDRRLSPRGPDAAEREESYALVSSFGFSGTNASIVLASPPPTGLSKLAEETGHRLRGHFFPMRDSEQDHPFFLNCRHKWVDLTTSVKAAYIQIGRYTTVWNQLAHPLAKPLAEGDGSYFLTAVVLELILATAAKTAGPDLEGKFDSRVFCEAAKRISGADA